MSRKTLFCLDASARTPSDLQQHPILRAAVEVAEARHRQTTYFGTKVWSQPKHEIALCVSREKRDVFQQVTHTLESSGGLRIWDEWRFPSEGTVDLRGIDDEAVAHWLSKRKSKLQPVFETHLCCTAYRYAPQRRPELRILIAIEDGTISAAGVTVPHRQVRLELECGSAADLLKLGAALAHDLSLLPADLSIADRGYRMLTDLPVMPLHAEPSSIADRQSVIAAFVDLSRACVRQWIGNANATARVAAADAPEFIHQLRVGLRRLRSLLKVFSPVLPGDFVSAWKARLGDTANQFGAARDLDVLHSEVLDPITFPTLLGKDAFASLRSTAEAARQDAYESARRCLDPIEQGRMVLEFHEDATRLLATSDWLLDEDLRRFARRRLGRLRKRARCEHEAASDGDAAALHRLRIGIKELRYAIEFFAPLFPDKDIRRYVAHLTEAQAALGQLQDLEVARGRIAEWLKEDPSLALAGGFVIGWHAPRYGTLRHCALAGCTPILWGKVPWEHG